MGAWESAVDAWCGGVAAFLSSYSFSDDNDDDDDDDVVCWWQVVTTAAAAVSLFCGIEIGGYVWAGGRSVWWAVFFACVRAHVCLCVVCMWAFSKVDDTALFVCSLGPNSPPSSRASYIVFWLVDF